MVPDVHPTSHPHPTPAGRHSRDDVIDAALDILQERGLPGLTMRRLAQSLGIQPSALYWHVADKQSLLAALSARILAPAAPAPPATPSPTPPTTGAGTPSSDPGNGVNEDAPDTGWEQEVRDAARDLRDALLAVRDGAEVVSSSLALGLVDLPLAECTTPALLDAGASPRTAASVASTLGHFVLGHTFDEQQRLFARETGILDTDTDTDERDGPRATFEDGVRLVVAGTAVLITLDRAEEPDSGGATDSGSAPTPARLVTTD